MRQVKAVLELRYEEFPPLFKYKEKVLSALNAQGGVTDPAFLENVDIKVTEQFAHINVGGKRLLIMIERAEKKAAQNFMVGVIDKLESLLSLQNIEIQQLGYRCMFIRESDNNFTEMVEQFKSSLYQDVPLLENAVDIGSPITYKIDGCKVNFMSGPMEPSQLKTLLEFPEANRKHVYFVDIDFIKNNLHLSGSYVKDFITKVQTHQKQLIEKWEEAVIYE